MALINGFEDVVDYIKKQDEEIKELEEFIKKKCESEWCDWLSGGCDDEENKELEEENNKEQEQQIKELEEEKKRLTAQLKKVDEENKELEELKKDKLKLGWYSEYMCVSESYGYYCDWVKEYHPDSLEEAGVEE